MNVSPKDSPLIIEFLSAFSMLRDACDDDPNSMIRQALDDSSFSEICYRTYAAYMEIVEHENENSETLVPYVGRNFIKNRRLFEEKYKLNTLVAAGAGEDEANRNLALAFQEYIDLSGQSVGDYLSNIKTGTYDEMDWNEADFDSDKISKSISDALIFAREAHEYNIFSDDFYNHAGIAVSDLEYGLEKLTLLLSINFGPDTRGLFRRRAITPLILAPTRVSHGNTSSNKASMLSLLEQAQKAFIFGTPIASLTLLRAILEIVFKEYYRVDGRDLSDRINNGAKHLPRGVYANDLHLLRMEANSLLHDKGSYRTLKEIKSEKDLELKIANHIDKVRIIVESLAI